MDGWAAGDDDHGGRGKGRGGDGSLRGFVCSKLTARTALVSPNRLGTPSHRRSVREYVPDLPSFIPRPTTSIGTPPPPFSVLSVGRIPFAKAGGWGAAES